MTSFVCVTYMLPFGNLTMVNNSLAKLVLLDGRMTKVLHGVFNNNRVNWQA